MSSIDPETVEGHVDREPSAIEPGEILEGMGSMGVRRVIQGEYGSWWILWMLWVGAVVQPALGAGFDVEDPSAGRLTELAWESDVFGLVELLVYTPPGYFTPLDSNRYPVVYWLHGSGDNHLAMGQALAALDVPGNGAVEKLDSLIEAGTVPPVIMVGIGAPGGSWSDTLLPLVAEEVPAFVDQSLRTLARSGGRGLEGFSLGSEGVSRYATARPDVFAGTALLGGGFLANLWIDREAAILRDTLEVAQFVGDQDGFLLDAQNLADELDLLGIPNQLSILAGVGHSATLIYESAGVSILQSHADRRRRALVVDAGPDQTLDTSLPMMTSLVGSIDDPEGLLGTFTTTWEQVSGPSMASFDDSSSLSVSVTLPVAGTYQLRLLAEGDTVLNDTVKVVAVDTASSLELHLSFDDGTAADGSGNGRDGTLVGGPTPVPDGTLDGALNFDGTDDSVLITDFAYGPEWSLALWVRAADLSGSSYQYVASHNGFDQLPSFNLYLPENSATFAEHPSNLLEIPEEEIPEEEILGPVTGRVRSALRDVDDGAGQFPTVNAPIDDGEWHHLVVNVPSTGGYRMLVDGEDLAGGIHGGDAFDPPGDLVFGTRSVSPTGRHFEGELDDVRLYGRSLSEEEILLLSTVTDANSVPRVSAGADLSVYLAGGAVLAGSVVDDGAVSVTWTQQSGPGTATFADSAAAVTSASFDQPGIYILRLTADDGTQTDFDELEVTAITELEAGFLGYWPLDETSGLVANDISGLDQDGNLIGDVDLPAWIFGQDGSALHFDGSDNQAVVIPGSALLDPDPTIDDFSILLWLRALPGAEGTVICRAASDPSARQFQIFLNDPGDDGSSELITIVGGLRNDQAQSQGVRVDDGGWHHVALIHKADLGTQSLFVDGAQVGLSVSSGAATLDVAVLVGARRISADDTGIALPLTGDVDDVRFYGRALVAAEIMQVIEDAQCSEEICMPFFADGFETGDTSGWSTFRR